MVKTLVHTCKDCNKIYASYQSLCNHRTRLHKGDRLMLDQPSNSITSANISHTSAIEESTLYKCRTCNKTYKHIQSRFKHEVKYSKNIEIINDNNDNIITPFSL